MYKIFREIKTRVYIFKCAFTWICVFGQSGVISVSNFEFIHLRNKTLITISFMFILPKLNQVDVRAMTNWSVTILAVVLLGMLIHCG
jgi:hypothetical protein